MVRTLSVAAPNRKISKKAPKKTGPGSTVILSGRGVHRTPPTSVLLPPSTAARRDDFTPLLIDYDETTVADLVGRISQTLANYAGPDHFTELDIIVSERLR